MGDGLQDALTAFASGKPVCVFDAENREGETDLLYPGAHAGPAVMRRLRQACGGLLFLAIGHEVGEAFRLPYLQDLHSDEGLVSKHPVLQALQTNDLQYDTRSAFTLSINHRDTFTGITDRDRALTTRRFAELTAEVLAGGFDESERLRRLGAEFRTPGHIPVCREAEGGLARRQGHTELAVGLARAAGVVPVVIGAEMLQPDGDAALPVRDAEAWAAEHGIPFVHGAELVHHLVATKA
jgi:3,4-dihydroxy 2-butanone 4-phosphate synthase